MSGVKAKGQGKFAFVNSSKRCILCPYGAGLWTGRFKLIARSFRFAVLPPCINYQRVIAMNFEGKFSTSRRRPASKGLYIPGFGHDAARQVDIFLTGATDLPEKGCCDLPVG